MSPAEHPEPALEDEGPSRSRRRRDALAVLALATRLTQLGPAALAALALPDAVAEEVRNVRSIHSHVAHKRQLQYLAKLLRRLDADALQALHDTLAQAGEAHAQDVARLHRIEATRDALLAEGDAALTPLLQAQPGLDTQRIRALLRQARREAERGKPPRAARELFQLLRATLD